MKTKTYGCRASIPFSNIGGSRYGGNTSCMTVESEGVSIVLDAGSGLMLLEKELRDAGIEKPQLNILISHLHLDHIIGFGTFSHAWDSSDNMRVYTCSRDGRPLKEQLFGAFKPPYWPSGLDSASGAQCIAVESGTSFEIGHMTVTPFLASHPDKTLSFHITDGKKTFVHLLDNEVGTMDADFYNDLVELCWEADMVVFDSAYSTEDYRKLIGWGHSTVEQGVKLAKDCKAKRMIFSHFDQRYSDEEIDSWARFFEGEAEFILGRDGAEVEF